jgi:hypothetical protein
VSPEFWRGLRLGIASALSIVESEEALTGRPLDAVKIALRGFIPRTEAIEAGIEPEKLEGKGRTIESRTCANGHPVRVEIERGDATVRIVGTWIAGPSRATADYVLGGHCPKCGAEIE